MRFHLSLRLSGCLSSWHLMGAAVSWLGWTNQLLVQGLISPQVFCAAFSRIGAWSDRGH